MKKELFYSEKIRYYFDVQWGVGMTAFEAFHAAKKTAIRLAQKEIEELERLSFDDFRSCVCAEDVKEDTRRK